MNFKLLIGEVIAILQYPVYLQIIKLIDRQDIIEFAGNCTCHVNHAAKLSFRLLFPRVPVLVDDGFHGSGIWNDTRNFLFLFLRHSSTRDLAQQ